MRQVRAAVPIPLATKTVVVNFEQLPTNIRDPAVDIILPDTTFWGGIRPCIKAAAVCETVQSLQARCLPSSLVLPIAGPKYGRRDEFRPRFGTP
jgi:L-alanine-DL-glutamate epimerase-like enolase superfamily enzyme